MITFFTWFSRFISWWSSKIFFSWWCSSVFLSVGLLPGFSFSFPLTSFFSLSSSFSLFMFWPTFLFCSDNPEGGSFSTWCSSLWKALSSSPFPKSHIKKYYKKLMVNCCFHSNFLHFFSFFSFLFFFLIFDYFFLLFSLIWCYSQEENAEN